MKYLKVTMSGNKLSYHTVENLAERIAEQYDVSVGSVEICDEVQVPEIKKTEIGILDIGKELSISNNTWQCDITNGDIVNLNRFPELRRHCKDIESKWSLATIKELSLLVVTYAHHSECGYLHFNKDGIPYISQFSDLSQSRRYIADTAISIRIVEVPE